MDDAFKFFLVRETVPMLYCDANHRAINQRRKNRWGNKQLRTIANTPWCQQETIIGYIRTGCEFLQAKNTNQTLKNYQEIWKEVLQKNHLNHLNICEKTCCMLKKRLNQIFQVVSTRRIRTKYLKCKTPTTKVMANKFIDHTMKRKKDFVQPIVDDGIIRLYLPIFSQNKSIYQEKSRGVISWGSKDHK